MYIVKDMKPIRTIGFISTRFQGTDGVSLETEKWVSVLKRLGFKTFFFAGQSDWNGSMVVPEAFFDHPRIEKIQKECFNTVSRTEKTTKEIHRVRELLKKSIYMFIREFSIDMLIVENALAIPMHIPLGLAITEVIAETSIPTIAHHHDFYWERQRFLVNSVSDYIAMAFPPRLHSIAHVVINTEARQSLSYRNGLSSFVIPNVFDYEREPPGIDEYNADVRKALGISDDDVLFLQPTRIIARKGIEHAVELVNRMKTKKAKLLISHQEKDEGKDYYNRIVDYAKLLNVDLIMRPDIISAKRGQTEDGGKIYSLWDIYPHADFITYPSTYEGFGNAFLEALYFKKPVMVNRYSIYQEDIEPVGFETVLMDTYITGDEVKKVKRILKDRDLRDRITQKNYDLAKKYFSFDILEQKLKLIFLNFGMKL